MRFAGKRVAVIGTGATGVQTLQEVAKTAAQLTVFQRTPNWCAPQHNGLITDEAQREIKASHPETCRRRQETDASFLHTADPRSALEVSDDEREAFFAQRDGERGFGIWVGNFRDKLTDPRANALISEFVARKIRQRVHDPVLAEKLIPKHHGFGTRRLPLETHCDAVDNQPNVEWVDLTETPIERITPEGIQVRTRALAFDMVIDATGFDALTGAHDHIDMGGVGGQTRKDHWTGGAKTFAGMQVAGSPNLLMVMGPHSVLGNIPRSIECNVGWVSDLLRHLRDRGLTRVEAQPESVLSWMETVRRLSIGLLSNDVDSWATGANRHLAHQQTRVLSRCSGSAYDFRAHVNAMATNGDRGMQLD